jgi:hypothetical protein
MFDRRYLKGSLFLGLALSLMGCSSPSLVSIQITPNAEYFGGPGLTAQYTAIGTFNQGNHPKTTRDITNEVTWKSNASAVATVSNTGMATSGFATGSTAITASMNGFTGLITANATAVVCKTVNSTGTGCGS